MTPQRRAGDGVEASSPAGLRFPFGGPAGRETGSCTLDNELR